MKGATLDLENWWLHVFNSYKLRILIFHRTIKLGPEYRGSSSKYQLVSRKNFTIYFKTYISSFPTVQKLAKILAYTRRWYRYGENLRSFCMWSNNANNTMYWKSIIFEVVWCLENTSLEKSFVAPTAISEDRSSNTRYLDLPNIRWKITQVKFEKQKRCIHWTTNIILKMLCQT